MKIKRICMIMLVAVIAITSFVVPAYAVTNFSSANHLLSHIAYMSDVTLEGVNLNVVGNTVKVDNVDIGYWYESEPSTLYADEGKSSKLIEETADGFVVEPSILKKLLTGINIGSMKVYAINMADYILVTEDGWLVNGDTPLVQFVPTQEVTTSGSDISMTGAVEVIERNFNVIVPAVLPMVADTDGNVTTATNATIINKSNGPVKVTSLNIASNANSGWRLVADTPSTERGANEFTFDTSLMMGDVIPSNSELDFTYRAKMSPIEDNVNAIDIVTVTITLDWEEE